MAATSLRRQKPSPTWHAGVMAKEIDRARAGSALADIKQHPAMVLFALSPALIVLGAVWWLFGAGWATLLLVALVLGGGAAVVMKRK